MVNYSVIFITVLLAQTMTKNAKQRQGTKSLGSEQLCGDGHANLLDLIHVRGIQTTVLHTSSKHNWELSTALQVKGLKLFMIWLYPGTHATLCGATPTKELPLGGL